jgi:site-specific recombinase XerD
MTTATFIKKPKRLRRLREGPLGAHLELFSARLLIEGHCQQSAWRNIRVVDDFGRWLTRKGLGIRNIDEGIVDRYMAFRTRYRHPFLSDRPALNRFLAVLRDVELIAPQRVSHLSAHEQIVTDFHHHLREQGGFAPKTIIGHLPTLRRFLAEHCALGSGDLSRLAAADIVSFVAHHAPHQSTRSTQHMCWSLRAFLRYLRYKGLIVIDLASAVPPVRTWRFASLPRYLAPGEVQKVLDAIDRRTALGLRDYAVLLLLARLGLRASEVTTMSLQDIDWQSGLVTICGKGRQRAQMPLPHEVGAAIGDYLQHGRPRSESRRVFLREWAPHIGFASAAAVTMIARVALERAKVDTPRKGAHVFRHTLATQLLRSGASLTQIGQLLRHHSHDSTRIYAKVDIEALRGLAVRWPGGAS